jgi:hypothetical protein
MRIKPFDIAALIVAVLVLVAVSVRAYSQPVKNPLVRVQAGDSSWLYPLDEERRIQPLGEHGTCVVEIGGGAAGVVESDCPQQICMTMGPIFHSGQWIACLPHGVFIDLVGADAGEFNVDGGTY